MIRYLRDPANAITTLGLVFAVAGLHAALSGHLELAVAAVLWSLLADHLDGIVAGRTHNRMPDAGKIGKQLDSFTDLVSDSVFPAVVVIQLNGASKLSLVIAVVLLVAGALRLSYFNNFGLSAEGQFIGVPLSYDVPLLAVLFLARPLLPAANFPFLVDLVLVVLAVLHVVEIRVPRASGAFLASIVVFSVVASAFLASRSFA